MCNEILWFARFHPVKWDRRERRDTATEWLSGNVQVGTLLTIRSDR